MSPSVSIQQLCPTNQTLICMFYIGTYSSYTIFHPSTKAFIQASISFVCKKWQSITMITSLLTYPLVWLFWSSIIVVLSCISYLVVTIIYNLRYHPYAKYPGPFLARISPLHALLHAYRGDLHLDVTRCHERYGVSPFLRVSPGESVDDMFRQCCPIHSQPTGFQHRGSYAR